jgi:hypothetical protein
VVRGTLKEEGVKLYMNDERWQRGRAMQILLAVMPPVKQRRAGAVVVHIVNVGACPG